MRKLSLIILVVFQIFNPALFAQAPAQSNIYGDRLKMGFVSVHPISYNPMIARSEYENELNNLVFGDGLFTRAPQGHYIHGLALSSEREQPRIWLINLRSNIFFHDGEEITAEDVKFSFELYKKFAQQSAKIFDARLISTVQITNRKSLRIVLKHPIRDFRETIGLLPILPKKHYEHWMNYNLLSSLPPVEPRGNGYFVVRRETDNEIRLDVFLKHYLGRANLNGIDLIFFDTYANMVDAFIDGQIDLVTMQGLSGYRKIYRLSSDKEFPTVKRDNVKIYYILLNTPKIPFNDINIRRAFNYAVNRNNLVTRSLDKMGHVAKNLIDESSEFYSTSARVYNYNPLNSLNILRSAGYRQQRNGKLFHKDQELKFEFFFNAGSDFEETIVRLISINLAELGINMIPRPKQPKELNQLVEEGKFAAALRYFVYDPEKQTQALREFYQNELKSENGYRNFNSRVMNTAMSRSERAYTKEQLIPIMRQMQVQINQLSPCIFLFFEDRANYAINNRFENTISTIYQNLEYVVKIYPKNEWFVPKEKQKY